MGFLPIIFFTKIPLYNAANPNIISYNCESEYEKKYGTTSIVIKREVFQKAMRDEAKLHGIKIEWNKKLQDIQYVGGNDSVTAFFEDGSDVSGDCIVGRDGIPSRTRNIILPNGPQPKYFGNVAAGAITSYPPNKIKMN